MAQHDLDLQLPTAPVASSVKVINRGLRSIGTAADKANEKLGGLGRGAGDRQRKLGESAGVASGKVRKLGESAGVASGKTRKLGDAAGVASGKARKLGDSAQVASSKADKAGGIFQRVGRKARSMAAGLALGITALFGISAGLNELRQGVGATITLQGASNALEVVAGSAAGAAAEMAFVRSESDRLGLSIGPTASEFAKFSAAAIGSKLAGAGVRDVFSAVSEAGARLSLSAEQQGGALLALGQIMSKGTVQAEELRGQLGERIPGAFNIMARGLGVTTQELGKMLEQGKVLAEDALPAFAAELRRTFGTDAATRIDTAAASLARYSTAVFDARVALGAAFLPALAEVMVSMADTLQQNERLIVSFGQLSGTVLKGLVGALGVVAGNLDAVTIAAGALVAINLPAILTAITAAFVRLNAAMMLNPFVALAAGIALAGAALNKFVTHQTAKAQKAIDDMTRSSDDLRKQVERTEKALKSGGFEDLQKASDAARESVRDVTLELAKQRAEADRLFAEAEEALFAGAILEAWREQGRLIEETSIRLKRATLDTLALGEANDDAFAAALALSEAPPFESWEGPAQVAKKEVGGVAKAIESILDKTKMLTVAAGFVTAFGLSAADAGDAAKLKLAEGVNLADVEIVRLIDDLKAANTELERLAAGAVGGIIGGTGFTIMPATLEGTDLAPEPLLQLGEEFQAQLLGQSEDTKKFIDDVNALRERQEQERAAAEKKMVEAILDGADRYTSAFDDMARVFSAIGGELGNILAGLARSAGDISASFGDLKAARARGEGGLFSPESRQAGAATAGFIGQAGGALGLFGGGQSQFGGEKSGNFGAEGAQLGGMFGPWGAVIGGAIGLFVDKAGDEALILVEHVEGAAGGAMVKIAKAEGGLAEISQAIAASLSSFIAQFEQITGQALNAAVADIQIEIVDDLITVTTSTGTKGFRDLGEALGFAAERLLIANEAVEGFTDGLGKNVQKLIEGLTGPVQRGTFEEIVAALDLAGRADALAMGAQVPPEVLASFQEIRALREDEVALARQFGLDMTDVLALTNQRIQQTRDEISRAAGQRLGITDVLADIQAVTASMEAFGDFTAQEAESRIAAQEEAAKRVAGLEADIAKGLADAVGGVAEEGATLSTSFQGTRENLRGTREGMEGLGSAATDAGEGFKQGRTEITETVFELSELERELAIAKDEMEALGASLEGIPDAFSAQEIADVWLAGAAQVGGALIDMLQQVRGENFLAAEEKELQNQLFMLQLAAQLAAVQALLAATDLLSEAARGTLEAILTEGEKVLEGLAEGSLSLGGGGRGGGGQRRQLRETFRESALDIEQQLAGVSDAALASADALAELRKQGHDARIPVREIAQAVSNLAALQLGDIGDPFGETAQFQDESAVGGTFREITERAQQAFAAAAALATENPAAYEIARANIEAGLAAEMEQLGIDALRGLGGRADLRRSAQDAARDIMFLMNHLDELGLTAQQVGRQVLDNVLPDLFGIIESEAQAIIRTTAEGSKEREDAEGALAMATANRLELERALTRIQLEGLHLQLVAAGAMTDSIQGYFDLANDLLDLSNEIATRPTRAGDDEEDDRRGVIRRGSTTPFDTSKADDLLARIEEQIREWTDAVLGPVAQSAKELRGTLDELMEGLRPGSGDQRTIDRLLAAFGTRVGVFVAEALRPFEELGKSAGQIELDGIIDQFDDLRQAFEILEVGADGMARLADAQLAALDAFWERQTEGIRGLLEELEATDPRRTGEELFTTARDQFQDLAARARGGDLEALAELEGAGRDLLAQTESFLGESGAGLAERDRIMETLRDVLGTDFRPGADDPVLAEAEKSNVYLAEIANVLTGRGPTQTSPRLSSESPLRATQPVGGDGGSVSSFALAATPVVVVQERQGVHQMDPQVVEKLAALVRAEEEKKAQAAADREGQQRVDEIEDERAARLQASMDRGAASMERASDAAERNQQRAGGVGR